MTDTATSKDENLKKELQEKVSKCYELERQKNDLLGKITVLTMEVERRTPTGMQSFAALMISATMILWLGCNAYAAFFIMRGVYFHWLTRSDVGGLAVCDAISCVLYFMVLQKLYGQKYYS